ncbi:hypothetical protein MBLNU230_g1649t1 [Neophaeotheca triangularis]
MIPQKSERRVYSAELLNRLRATVSQPKLSEAIEQYGGEDAELLKEHVLRGSKSFTARSFRSRVSTNKSLRVPSNNENRSVSEALRGSTSTESTNGTSIPLGEINSNAQQVPRGINGPWRLRPSPTPSMKRKKAEAILKAHGSPPHVRVTAGGRIVPSEQSPLCHPRYGYSAVQLNGGLIKFAPNHPAGKAQWMQATQNGFVAQDVNGRLCQIVDGFILPLNEVDGALRLFMHAPNLNVQSNSLPFAQPPAHVRSNTSSNQGVNHGERPKAHGASLTAPPEPSIASQISALDLEYSKREHELKDLNKSEVLHSRDMSKVARDALVGKRRELITTLDHIRRAIKGLKEDTQGPPAHAPTSPRAMQDDCRSTSPRGRLPTFLQQRAQQNNGFTYQAPPQQSAFEAPAFGMIPHSQEIYPAPYPFAAMQQSSTMSCTGGSFSAPPPAMFNPPPPFFDGSNSALIAPFSDGMKTSAAQPQQATELASGFDQQTSSAPTQNDGARSHPDLKIPSQGGSHALPIRAPEASQSRGAKSALNPMSPVYTPGKGLQTHGTVSVRDRAPTPMSPLHNSAKQTNTKGPSSYSGTPVTVHSPSKSLRQQSSAASFQTVDFFPRNTREYSTRKDAYPIALEASEDKENVCSQPAVSFDENSPYTPDKPYIFKPQTTGNRKNPSAPPATPVDSSARASQVPLPHTIDNTDWRRQMNATDPAGHREKHNLSPKSKRQDWLFVSESPSKVAHYPSSSPAELHQCQEELCVTASPSEQIDFSDKSREYIEGFQAGITRQSVGPEKYGQFLLGYCAGILRTKPADTAGPSKGSRVKPAARRTSPVPMNSEAFDRLTSDHQRHATGQADRPPFELNLDSSTNTFKQAILAPQNENAVLTPGPDGPRVGDQPLNLGAWAKAREITDGPSATENLAAAPKGRGEGAAEFPFPYRQTSSQRKDSVQSGQATSFGSTGKSAVLPQDHIRNSLDGKVLGPTPVFSNKTGNQLPDSRVTSTGSKSPNPAMASMTRIDSITSTDSQLHRQYAGHRIISPNLDWKSTSSIAQATGLAAGFFAHAQIDGTVEDPLPCHTDGAAELTTPAGSASAMHQAPGNTAAAAIPAAPATAHPRSRFRENSIDGTSPVCSPPLSPTLSPLSLSRASSPTKHERLPVGRKEKESPSKHGTGGSPARAKFESIAGKVGIKVAVAGGKQEEQAGVESVSASPQGKRRWRDVWKGGNGKKEGSKEEVV